LIQRILKSLRGIVQSGKREVKSDINQTGMPCIQSLMSPELGFASKCVKKDTGSVPVPILPLTPPLGTHRRCMGAAMK
jgi:hypothetical protein